jgi:predicted phage tail protein
MQAEYLKANQTYIATLKEQEKLRGGDIGLLKFRQNLTAQINKLEDQQRKTMQETLESLQKSQEEYNSKLAEQNDLLEWFSDMTKEIEDDEKKKNDLLKERIKFQADSNKEALDGQNDLAKARQAYAETEAELNAQAAGTSNVEGLSTAIGSIKVAGSTDFSIEKQMDIAKQQLNAIELHTDILQEIADSLNAMGGTT